MKTIIAGLCLLIAPITYADHLDTFSFTLKKDCSFKQYMKIVKDFNEWGKNYGYVAEIAAPLFSEDLETYYWLGRSESVEAFGKALANWMDERSNKNSVPSKLSERFSKCEEMKTRHSYNLYPK